MGEPTAHSPALLLLAAFSRHEAALTWTRQQVVASWGPVALESPVMSFADTDYYVPSMGSDLLKVFHAFQEPLDPARLAEIKLQTNRWEREYAEENDWQEPRPLNLDPGYLTLGKLVLASTKDHAHRIYLRQGVYAEVTLYYSKGTWHAHPWTYPDYRRHDFQQFFSQCRDYLHRTRKEAGES